MTSLRAIMTRRDFVVLLVCILIQGMGHSFVLPFISIFGTEEVGMSSLEFGVFMTLTSLSGIGIATYLSRASDLRIPRKQLLVAGSIAGALGHVGYAFVRDYFGLLAIGAGLLGVASVTYGQIFAYARDLLDREGIEPRQVPFYMNIFRLFFALSWTVGPACAAWMMSLHSYEGSFLGAAALFAGFALAVALFVPSLPPPEKTRLAAGGMPLSETLRAPYLRPHFFGFVLFFATATVGMMNLPLFIIKSLHGTETHVGWAFSIKPIFELPFMFYMGLLATRIPSGVLIRTAILVASGFYFLLSFVTAPEHVYPLQILDAGVVAVMGGVAITFFQSFLPHQTGTATNVYVTAQRLGSMAGYLAFGFLLPHLGHRGLVTLCALGACASYVILLSARRADQATQMA